MKRLLSKVDGSEKNLISATEVTAAAQPQPNKAFIYLAEPAEGTEV